MEKLNKLIDLKQEIAAYKTLLNIEYYDSRTIAPRKSLDLSNKLSSLLSLKLFELSTNPELEKLIEELSNDKNIDNDIRLELKLELDNIKNNKCIPNNEYLKGIECFKTAEVIWQEARDNNDYKIFKPALENVVRTRKKWISYRGCLENIYQQLLNDYQKGSSLKMYDQFFDLIKLELVPLINKIETTKKQIDDSFLYQKIDIEKQRRVVKIIAEYLGFKNDFGYIGESTHPFSMFINKDNIRITTKYIEDNICSTIFSVIHEIGHGLYSQNVDYKFIGSEKESLISMGMHESQSRFFENCIGKSFEFWEYLYPIIQKEVKEFENITLENFYLAINKSSPSLIRTESDELIYPIHVLIRYELEKKMINEDLDFEQLNLLWNEKYKEYLGVNIENDLEGILQDVHWCSDIGYFPTYALGSAIAAQLNSYLIKNIDMLNLLKKGRVFEVIEWLKNNIHQYGGIYDYNYLLMKATHEEFNPKYYIEYLKNKFEKIYKL